MIVFKPRLALFYVVALVVISLLTNRLTISTQIAEAASSVKTTSKTNVESSK